MEQYRPGLAKSLLTTDTITYQETKQRKRRKIEELDITCCFDIETTSYYLINGERHRVDDNSFSHEKNAHNKRNEMYIWMFGIGRNVLYGRTWAEFREFFKELASAKKGARLTVWVHNLAYEFQYIRKMFEWFDVFAIDSRGTVRAETMDGFVFRCSYKESGKSLATIGDEIGTHKKSGDLDYLVLRDSTTPLTKKELEYCEFDIIVLYEYIEKRKQQRNGRNNILLTKTGYVREYMRNRTLFYEDTGKLCYTYKDIMDRLKISDLREYNALVAAFAGGFTHANVLNVGAVFSDVWSFDLSSSYPATLCCEKFPMSSATYYNNPGKELFRKEFKKNLLVLKVIFYNLRRTTNADCPLSSSKCHEISDEKILDNGRVLSCDWCITTITSIDFDTFSWFYRWDDFEVVEMWSYKADYLPRRFISAILDLYVDKTRLKGLKGVDPETGLEYDEEYVEKKETINSVYGMLVQSILREIIEYDDGWKNTSRGNISTYTKEDVIKQYNTSRQRFTFYPWGVFCTAYSRRRILSAVRLIGSDHIYTDTDSEKITNPEEHQEVFEFINEETRERLFRMCRYHGLDFSKTRPLDKKGVAHPLGEFECDGKYAKFKTLGAKRYMYYSIEKGDRPYYRRYKDKNARHGWSYKLEKGRFHTTIAGVNKIGGADWFSQFKDPFDAFCDGAVIEPEGTKKLLLTYLDEGEVPSVFMEPTTYRVGMNKDYVELLRMKRIIRIEGVH